MMGDQNGGQSAMSLDVRSPPDDNFYLQDTTSTDDGGGIYYRERNNGMQRYSTNSKMLVEHMLQQMNYMVKDNQELKRCIKMSNQELRRKFLELKNWKEKNKTEAELLRQHHAKARSVVIGLRDENAILRAENLKLESKNNKMHINDDGESLTSDETASDHNNKPKSISTLHEKYVTAVENLERQLKESLSSQEVLKTNNQHLRAVNIQLQQRIYSDQGRLNTLEALEQKILNLEKGKENLLKEIQVLQERFQMSERSNKEVKSQLIQLVNEGKTYEYQAKEHRDKIETAQIENKTLKDQNQHAQERITMLAKDNEKLQERNENEISKLQRQLSERTRSLDELFHEYDKVRVEKDRLFADRAQTSDVDNLFARLLSSEESISKKDRELKELEERMKNEARQKEVGLKKLEEDVAFFKAQADVYKQDFLIEREDRAKLHDQLEKMQKQYEQFRFDDPCRRQDNLRR